MLLERPICGLVVSCCHADLSESPCCVFGADLEAAGAAYLCRPSDRFVFIPADGARVRFFSGWTFLVTEEGVFANKLVAKRFNHEGEVAGHSTGLERSLSCFGASNGESKCCGAIVDVHWLPRSDERVAPWRRRAEMAAVFLRAPDVSPPANGETRRLALVRRSRVLEAVVHARGRGADVFSSCSRANESPSRGFTYSTLGVRTPLADRGVSLCALDDSSSIGRESLGSFAFRGTPALTAPCV